MALTVTSRGTGTHNTGATTLVPGGRTATLAAGSMGVFCIAVDNAGSAGATTICPATWTDAKGNVWTRRQNALYDNGAASAGIEMGIYTADITVALLTTDLGTITWVGGVSPVAKAWTWYEVIPAANAEVEYSTGGTIAGATAANAQVVTASVPVGDAVIAGYFAEGVAAVTGDSDSTNGTWTAQQTATIGATTSGVRIATQQKVQTTTASTQSYDVTVASQDRIAGYIRLHEGRTAEASVVAAGGGVVSVAGVANRPVAPALTGGGSLTAAPTTNRAIASTATGGGVAVAVGTTARSLAGVFTGGGVATVDAVAEESTENHDVSVVVTGGGVVATVASTDRPSAPAATGGGIAAIAATSERAGAIAATGAGAASLSVAAARAGAALMSGGGVLAADPSTQRSGSVTATGGGVAVIDGTSEVPTENHDVSVALTGGGQLTVDPIAGRIVSLVATGSGAILITATVERLAELLATGGGAATISWNGQHFAVLNATGGGEMTINEQLPPGLPEDLEVTVVLEPVPSATVGAQSTGVTVALEPIPTVEVR